MMKLKLASTKMMFPHLGRLEDWVMVGLGDAGIKCMPDKMLCSSLEIKEDCEEGGQQSGNVGKLLNKGRGISSRTLGGFEDWCLCSSLA